MSSKEPAVPDDPRHVVLRLVFGQMAAQTVAAAARLGVADAFGEATRSPSEIAADLGTDTDATRRLLRALAALGLLREAAADEFSLTEVGAALRTDHPESMAGLVRMFTDPTMITPWHRLDDSVRTGETAFDKVFGVDFFGYLKQNPELSALFNTSMQQGTRGVAAALAQNYDFSRFKTIVDVGGGDGTLLAAALAAHDGPRGVVFDSTEGGAQAEANFAAHGLTERTEVAGGDFFTEVPAGGDLYLVKSIIHDWDDARCQTILRNIRAVLPEHGRLLIVEPVLADTVPEPTMAGFYLSDLNMLVNVGGKERTRAEFEALCTASGFGAPTLSMLPAPNTFWVIEAAPV